MKMCSNYNLPKKTFTAHKAAASNPAQCSNDPHESFQLPSTFSLSISLSLTHPLPDLHTDELPLRNKISTPQNSAKTSSKANRIASVLTTRNWRSRYSTSSLSHPPLYFIPSHPHFPSPKQAATSCPKPENEIFAFLADRQRMNSRRNTNRKAGSESCSNSWVHPHVDNQSRKIQNQTALPADRRRPWWSQREQCSTPVVV